MVLDTAMRRGVQCPTRDLVHTDLPVPRERRPTEGHGHPRVGGEGGNGGVHVHVLTVVVSAYWRRSVGGGGRKFELWKIFFKKGRNVL